MRDQFNINNIPGVAFRACTLRVLYSAPSDVSPVSYSEAEFPLN